MSLGQIFLSEFLRTAFPVLLRAGAVAMNLPAESKSRGTGWLMTNSGWGLAVFIGVYVAYGIGGYLNPAVTLGLQAASETKFVLGMPANAVTICTYIAVQPLSVFVGTILVWLAYKKYHDEHESLVEVLGTFLADLEIRFYGRNLAIEAIATFVLVAWVLTSGDTKTAVGLLVVALVIVAIGTSLGGSTGYTINQARDLGPRVAHVTLPIRNKDSLDWAYA